MASYPSRSSSQRPLRELVDGLDHALRDDEAPSILEALETIGRRLVAHGFHELSPFWWETFRNFYRGRWRVLVARVGRRGGKSSSVCRLAIVEALYGDHHIPAGDTGVVAIVSVDRREAGRRVRTIRAILDALGEPYAPIDGGVQLTRRPIAFQVFTATISGVSGFTCVFAFCDEVAKWRDADTGANPASEVLASLRPTMATQPNARMVLSSSPLGSLDAHAKAFDLGVTGLQTTAFAPTWESNPTISEADTHELEPDESKWRREYGAIPMEGNEESLLSAAMLDAVSDMCLAAPAPGWSYVAAMDPATRGNAWTLVVVTRTAKNERAVVGAWEWRGTPLAPLDPDRTLQTIAELLEPFHVKHVWTDQWAADPLSAIARRHGLKLMQYTLTATSKVELYEGLAARVADKKVLLAVSDRHVRADLLGIRRRVTASGLSIALQQTPDGRHSDYAPPVAIACEQHCAPPKTIETSEEKWEKQEVKRAIAKFGNKKKTAWWKRGPQ